MSSTLREKLRLSQTADNREVTDICNKYLFIYENVLKSSSNEQVKKIARNRISDLRDAAQSEGISLNTILLFDNTNNDSDSTVESMLTSFSNSQGTITNSEASKIETKINSLPECARKYYLKCCLIKGTKSMSVETVNELIATISNATKLDPSNFVYKQISNDIVKSLNQYQSELDAWKRSEEERIQHEKNVETTKKVFGVIGTILLGILGAIGAVIAGAFALCCESCDC